LYVVYGYAELHLPYSHSLKEKRGIVHGLSTRIKKRFNVSLAEVDHHDLWQRSRLGFSAVSQDMPTLQLIINSIRESLESYTDEMEVLDFTSEITSF